jgi:hypothetical protein
MFHRLFIWLFGSNAEEGGVNEILNNSNMNLSYIKSLRSKKEQEVKQSDPLEVAQKFLERERDKDQLNDFVKSLSQITGPELTDPECREILDSALVCIHTITMGIKEGVENI